MIFFPIKETAKQYGENMRQINRRYGKKRS